MKKFSRKAASELKHYVYALVDPRTEEIFYIGKGSGASRPFQHLKVDPKDVESAKRERIIELKNLALEPRVDVLRYGLDDHSAREVEAAVIDTIGLHRLSNRNSGSDSSERGRLSASQLEAKLGGRPLDVNEIRHPVILFYRRDSYPKDRLYDETRQFWALSEARIRETKPGGELKYQYAFAMRGNFVLEVYRILAWFPAGTTVSSRTYDRSGGKSCWEFIGSPAEETIRKSYCSKSLFRSGKPLHATQIGFRYLG